MTDFRDCFSVVDGKIMPVGPQGKPENESIQGRRIGFLLNLSMLVLLASVVVRRWVLYHDVYEVWALSVGWLLRGVFRSLLVDAGLLNGD